MEQARTARWLTCVTAVVAAFTLALVARADAQDPPQLTSVAIEGTAIVGQTLTTTVVDPDPLTTSYQWRRCPPGEQRCNKEYDITDAKAPSYTVTLADVGYQLMVVASRGGDDVRSTRTAIVPRPPEITAVEIDGNAIVGRKLTASAVATDATSVTYEWLRCDADGCSAIVGGDSYVVALNDIGHPLAVRATAIGPGGQDIERSALTNPVQQVPAVTSVTIAGQAVIGDMLTAKATATGFPAPTIQYRWLRCPADPDTDCQPIADATEASYAVEPADAAHTLVARATATNPAGADTARSAPTAAVPEPGLGDVFEQLGAAPVSGPLGTSTSGGPRRAKARYLRPFPVVRIKGVLVVGGAQVTLLRVKAPRGSRVNVNCRRSGCRLRGRDIGVGRIQALERFLPAGARITIRVVKRGFIGKYVRIVIRDGRLPVRRDACLLPGKRKPVRCPRP